MKRQIISTIVASSDTDIESAGSRVFAVEDLALLILDAAGFTVQANGETVYSLRYRIAPLMMVNRMFRKTMRALVARDLRHFTKHDNYWLRWFQPTELDLVMHRHLTIGSMQHLSALKKLCVGGPFDHPMSALIQRMTTLTELTVHDSARLIDKHLAPLTNLTSLKLRQCTKVTDKVFPLLTNLTSLSLDKGNYSITGTALSHLTSLTHLSLANNDFVSGRAIYRLSNLRSLDLSHNTQIESATLHWLTGLTSLKLDANAQIAPIAISRLTCLQHLSLIDNSSIKVQHIKHLTNLCSLTMMDMMAMRVANNQSTSRLHELRGLIKLETLVVGKSQSIATEKILEIYRIWPGLKMLGF